MTSEPTTSELGTTRLSKRRQYLAELVVGIAIAAALLWVAVASNQSVPFVYQGL